MGIADSVIDLVSKTIAPFIPDNKAKDAALAALAQKELDFQILIENNINEQSLAQAEINKIEAANSNFLISGWRPILAWTLIGSFIYMLVFMPFLVKFFGKDFMLISADQLMTLLTALLGLGWVARSYEKGKGINNNH